MPGPGKEDAVEKALKQFAVLGHQMHPLDWNRFYRFVALAHHYRKGWDAHELQNQMEQHGMPTEEARQYAEAYWHARCVLYVRDHPDLSPDAYGDWIKNGGTPLT